jgi:hypothetical protein
VTTAPVRDAAGEVIGGVEMFRDVSSMLVDFELAEQIQSQSLKRDLQYICIF